MSSSGPNSTDGFVNTHKKSYKLHITILPILCKEIELDILDM
jgi:hypothetical protein